MIDAGERAIREAILRGEASNDDGQRLVDMLADPLRRKIRYTFYYWTYSFNEQDCDDVLQTTFCKLIEKLNQCDPEKPLLPWAKTIAQHEVVNVLRERSRQWRASQNSAASASTDRVQAEPSKPDGAGRSDEADGEDVQLEAWEIEELEAQQEENEEADNSYTYDYGDNAELAANRKSEIFRNELAMLSDAEQTIVIEHYQNGRPLADLARESDINPEAMRQRASRTRKKLFERLVRYEEFKNLKKLQESAARQKK
jgi:RNA polymerase sigma factor (sigma-70 family)